MNDVFSAHRHEGSARLDPGQTYANRIVYRFSTTPAATEAH